MGEDIKILRELQSKINTLNGITDQIFFNTIGAIVWKQTDSCTYGNFKLGKVIKTSYGTDVKWFEEGHICKCIYRLRYMLSEMTT